MFTESSFPEFSAAQIKAAALAMLEVAKADGINPAEAELIREFWSPVEGELGPFDASTAESFDAKLFADGAQRLAVLDLCLACAFSDGKYGQQEKQTIASIASRLELSDADVQNRSAEVRAAFLGALAHLPDSSSVAALARNLE